MASKTCKTSHIQQGLSLIVLAVLSTMAWWVWQKQFDYNPAVVESSKAVDKVGGQMQTSTSTRASVPFSPADNLVTALPNLTIMSPPETFGPQTLADKINGKAELYLSSGFKALKAQRLALKANPESWLEVFVYDMGSDRNAFAVYSHQRRSESQPVPEYALAYRTANALFLAHGAYYLEIVASQATPYIPLVLVSVAEAVTGRLGSQAQPLVEPRLFPTPGLQTGTMRLSVSNVFGFEGLTDVFTADYRLEQGEATAFLSRRGEPAEAIQLAEAYTGFLLANGGQEVKDARIPPGLRVFNLADTFEVVMVKGAILAGVHGADNQAVAMALAAALAEKL